MISSFSLSLYIYYIIFLGLLTSFFFWIILFFSFSALFIILYHKK